MVLRPAEVIRRVVPPESVGDRADVVVARLLAVSRSRAAKILDEGGVTADGRRIRRSDRLADEIVLEVRQPQPAPAAAPRLPPVRWRDDEVVVVAKPAGMVVHPGAGNPDGTLVDALVAAGIPLASVAGAHRPGIVHRLDKGTSGLLVVACTDRAYRGLVDALRRHEVDRHYLALAQGTMPSVGGRIEAPIGRDHRDRQRFVARADGKPAVTHWQVRATGCVGPDPVSLLGCRLETGRTHQIRVHLALANTPVVADARYGASVPMAESLGLTRPFLHAGRIAFVHPVTGEWVTVVEPVPDDLSGAAQRAGVSPTDLDP